MLSTIGRVTRVGAAVLAFTLIGAGCSGSDSDGASDSKESDGVTASSTTTTEPMTDEEFAAAADEFTSGIESAGTDFCEIIAAGSAPLDGMPSNPAQVEQSIRVQAAVLDSLAASEPVDAANAAVLRETATKLIEAGTDAGFSTDFMTEGSAEVLGNEEFGAALQAYETRAASECSEAGAPETTTVG